MKHSSQRYQCAVIGGGLAGLCLSVQLAAKGIRVIVFEKYHYPFHKVCGEYISMESWDFLLGLGLPLYELALPRITQLGISSQKGFMLDRALDPGGFGLSRFSLDFHLSRIARLAGVEIIENCKVIGIRQQRDDSYLVDTTQGVFESGVICGSYGKYTPSGILKSASSPSDSGNYIGVKYHIKTDLAADRIELHNFRDGYCGVSKVDHDQFCLCYLTTSANLLDNEKTIWKMEQNVLCRNPFLRHYFENASFISQEPLVISNVGFRKKKTEINGMFLLGDAAGSITPLCGNGMSMAMHASKILAAELTDYIGGRQDLEGAHLRYRRAWEAAFGKRITAGYYLQNLFGKENMTDMTLRLLSRVPPVTDFLISLTHGERF